jgi:DNA-binding MarR family transcriptional regulator
MSNNRQPDSFAELSSLFFEMRQAIRANLPQGQADPNAWMRCETLGFIAENDRPTMQEIAKQLRVTAPSATSLVRKLFSLGWIERDASGSDKRVVRISLTAKGKKELSRYRNQSEKTMRKVFSKLPERDLLHLKRALRTLRDIHTG